MRGFYCKAALHQSLCISLNKGMPNNSVTDNPAVHIDIDSLECAACKSWRGDPALNRYVAVFKIQSIKMVSNIFSQNICRPVNRIRRWQPVFDKLLDNGSRAFHHLACGDFV